VRAITGLACLALALGLVSGCGAKGSPSVDDQTPANVLLQQAVSSLGQAPSYRVTGTTTDGQTTVELDLVYAGDRRKGTWARNGVQAELVEIGDVTYLKADAAFWQPFAEALPGQAAATLAGRWVELDGEAAAISEGLAPDIAGMLVLGDELTKGRVGTFGGKIATTVTDGSTTIYILLDEPRYPVRIQSPGGTLDLSDFTAAVTIDGPPADQVTVLSSE